MHRTFWKKDTVWNKKPKAKKAPNPEDACWRAFSEFVRLRDCLRTTGTTIAGTCVTCRKVIPMKGNDAGHFVSRVAWSIKYDPRNCHLQCTTCNRYQQGNWDKYMDFMRGFYGMGVVEGLLNDRHKVEAKWIDWKEEAAKWRKRTRTLLALAKDAKQSTMRAFVEHHMKAGTLESYLDGLEESNEESEKELTSTK